MKLNVAVLLIIATVCNALVSVEDGRKWADAATGVLNRLIPEHSADFEFVAVNTSDSTVPLPGLSNDFFTVEASGGKVTIFATSGVSMTSGAYWYLKEVANCQVTWGNNGTGDQLSLPAVLPDVARTTVKATVPIRYGWNMCTFSYSAVWWDEHRWQREIDWMALHGVNFPLALTGQEFVWMKVFERYNVTLDQLESWFSGPAFLAWQRAGNIRGFAGPLSLHWITEQAQLQQFILAQMRALGMKPILPCFAGHVPRVAKQVWPNASFTQSAAWNNFAPNETDVWSLDPTDPLYLELGSVFTEVMIDYFGTDHYYSCDTFNEVDPKTTNHTYLRAASAAVHNAIAAKDTQGIWVMQAWLFHSGYWNNVQLVEAYLSGVANDSMLILDLNSEAGVLATKYRQYYGKPWVWNMLHNYGGVRGVYGNMTEIATGPYISLHTPNSTMVGIGFTPEAIEQNPVMYELLTSTFWSPAPINVSFWLQRYVRQRYGAESPKAWAAWSTLFDAVYNQPGEPRSEIEWVPHWEQASFGWQNGNAELMFAAFKQFIDAWEEVPNAANNGPFLYDFVDVTRQATTMFFSDLHRQLDNEGWVVSAQQYNVTVSLVRITSLMKWIISTLDELLGTNVNYLLGTWTSRAMRLAQDNETDLFLYNAKNQITLWGPNAQICDYAAKAWNGLYKDYYLRRWSYMMDLLVNISANPSLSWNSWVYNSEALQLEKSWCANGSTVFPDVPPSQRSALEIANEIFQALNVNGSLLAAQYTTMDNTDSWGGDVVYTPTWTSSPHQLAVLCNQMEDCAGFTASGYLKQSLNPTSSIGSTLYTKKAFTDEKKPVKGQHGRVIPQPPRGHKGGTGTDRKSAGDEKSRLYGHTPN